MTRDELIARFRGDVFDVATPYLWSEDEVSAYADDAQSMFVRLIGGISDATSDLCLIDAPIGTEYVDYDNRILKIRQAFRADGTELDITNFEDHGRFGTRERLTSTPGDLKALVIGADDLYIRLHNIPAAAETIKLVVYRLPVAYDLTEIDAKHHIHLVSWMKHLAYGKLDLETYDKGKADQFGGEFSQYCVLAASELSTRKHKPRSVSYGGL